MRNQNDNENYQKLARTYKTTKNPKNYKKHTHKNIKNPKIARKMQGLPRRKKTPEIVIHLVALCHVSFFNFSFFMF